MADSVIQRFSKIATDPLRNFRFYAEFAASADGVFTDTITTSFTGGFTNISGLSVNTQAIGYREGGYNTTLHQVPGMTTFSPVTFQRGVLSGNDEAITWMRGLFAAAAGDGLAVSPGKGFRVDITVYVLDHPNAAATTNVAKMKFKIHNAWITTLSYSDLNATANELMFETMTLVHEGLSVDFV